jgi:hypothetical protein
MPIDGTEVIGGVDICMSTGGASEACWWQLRYVVSAARCNADWCSTPMKSASELPD